MSLPVFTPSITPSPGLQNKPEVKLLKADFGDGYTQIARDGINSVRRVYDLKWDVLLSDEADSIVNFFETQAGAQPFTYRIPGTATPFNWTCESWTDTTNSAGYRAITATFRQSFTLDN